MDKNHFLRYGTPAEQKYMREYQHTYDGIAINGTILAHISKGISAFVHKDINKKFFIDPMTHSFQHELEKIKNSQGEIKRSIKKLMDIFGEPINIVSEKSRPIKSSDFTKKNKSSFVNNVLVFQYQHLTKHLDDEYRDYVEYDTNLRREPTFLIAPYFYLKKDNVDTWLDLNIEMIDISLNMKSNFNGKDIYAQLVIDRHLLLDDKLDNVIDKYSKADGLLYWIDGLDETEASEKELTSVKKLIKTFKRKNPDKQIISLYGGYFSELLSKEGLYGVVHGLEYGETRDVVPVGGGIPLSKYYLPAIKKRVPAITMLSLLKLLNIKSPVKFHEEICKCEVCRKVIKNSIEDFNKFVKSKPEPKIIKYKTGTIREIYYPERESKELCLFHYLEVKNNEIKHIKKESKDTLIDNLNSSFDKYKNHLSEDEIYYLKRWAKVLEK